ncbi:MAG: DUF4276 family protein [Methyloprofundus sp.]|nr:DUF4276 family protein [Methyloprofundus sp.]
MIRVHVICEGQTEEAFVKELLIEPFLVIGIILLPALIGKPGHKGGNFKFERLLLEIRNRLLSDSDCYCTTFFDFYGLPESFPGKKAVGVNDTIEQKSNKVNDALVIKLTEKLGADAMRRFIPFIQMYEFEGLLFSDPEKMAKGMDRLDLIESFKQISNAFDTPEHINNSWETAPSKRIIKIIPGYEKPLMGTLAALEVGLSVMRESCGLFDQWLNNIELLAGDKT